MSDDKTTPRPWRILEATYGPIRVLDAHGNRVCEISCAMHLTADDILRAVNSHDDLVKALITNIEKLEYYVGNPSAWDSYDDSMSSLLDEVLKRSRAALEKAGVKT